MNKTPKMAINFEKKERLCLLPGWRTFLLVLQGFAPVPTKINHPLFGSWRGDEVHFVISGNRKQPEAIVEYMALQALQGSQSADSTYIHLAKQSWNITRQVAGLVARTPELRKYCFEEMAGRHVDYSSLTLLKLQGLLHGLKGSLGLEFYHQYVLWLATHKGFANEVSNQLQQEIHNFEVAQTLYPRK